MTLSQLLKKVKFNAHGLVPAIIQDKKTNQVLMVAYMNRLALKKTLESGKTYFWSRSRGKLWMKGESSGHTQTISEAFLDCDNDTILFKVRQRSAACHTGYYTCFHKKINLKKRTIKEAGKRIFDPKKVYK